MNNEEKILSTVEKILTRLDTMDEQFNTVNDRLGTIDGRLDTMQADISELKVGQNTIRADIAKVKRELKIHVWTDISIIDKRLMEVERRLGIRTG